MLVTVEGIIIGKRTIGENNCFIDILTDDNTVIDGYQKIEKDISTYSEKEYRIFFWEDKILKPIP